MTITGLELLVLSLAAYRASRALALDSITEPMRDWLAAWSQRSVKLDVPGNRWAYGGDHPVRRKVAELVSCGFCAGWWLSIITYAVFVTVTARWDDEPVLIHLITMWAVAGVQALMICLDSFLLTVKESVDDAA